MLSRQSSPEGAEAVAREVQARPAPRQAGQEACRPLPRTGPVDKALLGLLPYLLLAMQRMAGQVVPVLLLLL